MAAGRSAVSFVAIMVGAFGVYAGWHWKILHRAVRDVERYKAGVRSAQKAERELWGRAVLLGAVALVILIAMAKIH
jgi:hypothetical protein